MVKVFPHPPIPPDELERLGALSAYHMLDTPAAPAFDELVHLAAELFDVSTAAINLVDADRVWAKAAVGAPEHGSQIARRSAFCSWTIVEPHGPLVIADIARDPRFQGNPLIDPRWGFYAGVRLLSPEHLAVGTICVLDEHAQEPSVEKLRALRALGSAATAHLNLHERTLAAERASGELAAVLEQAPDAFISMGVDGRVRAWNAQAERLFGWRAEETVRALLAELIVLPEFRDAHREDLERYLRTGEWSLLHRAVEFHALRRDGATIPVELRLGSVKWQGLEHFNAFVRDISERKAIEAARDAELQGLRLLSGVQGRLARDGDLSAIWTDVCAAAVQICAADGAQLWKAEPDEGLRAHATAGADLTDELIRPGERSLVRETMSGTQPIFIEDATSHPLADAKLLERYEVKSLHFRPVIFNGAASAVVSLFWKQPRTQLSSREEHLLGLLTGEAAVAIERAGLLANLRELSNTDPLTGAANRRQLTGDLDRAIAGSHRRGVPLCAAILDLDHFKQFNDRHGHLAGDQLLKDSVSAWQHMVRAGDTVARYGGEEFALVLPDCDIDCAKRLIERLRGGLPHGQRCSVGVAAIEENESAIQLLRRADRALYMAKQAGRDTVCIDQPVETSA